MNRCLSKMNVKLHDNFYTGCCYMLVGCKKKKKKKRKEEEEEKKLQQKSNFNETGSVLYIQVILQSLKGDYPTCF